MQAFLRCRVSEYCQVATVVNFPNPNAGTTSRLGTPYRICKSNLTLFVFCFFKKWFILFLALITGSTDAWLRYLEESKRIKVSISITNVQQTVKMRSMLLNLYTVKNKTSYLHVMKSLTGTDIYFSHHQWGIKACYTGVKARSWIIYLFSFSLFLTSCMSWCPMKRNSVCPQRHALEVKLCSFPDK